MSTVKMDKAPEFLFGQEPALKRDYLVIYHDDGEGPYAMKVIATSNEHAIHIANAQLSLNGHEEYYLDLLIDPSTCDVLEFL